MGAIAATVDAIARHVGSACQLVVVCGRNKKLVQTLQARWDRNLLTPWPTHLGRMT